MLNVDKMFYVAYSDEPITMLSELSETGSGGTIYFPAGYVFTHGRNDEYYKITVDYGGKCVFRSMNELHARLKFLSCAILEMEKTGKNYYFYKTFNKYVDEFERLSKQHPEYAI